MRWPSPLWIGKNMLDFILDICEMNFEFDNFELCRYFQNLINLLRQMNYSKMESEQLKTTSNK